jgi:hypothetical protein
MRIAIGVALLAVLVPLALAQTRQDQGAVAGAAEVRVERDSVRAAARTGGRYADARHCLDFATNAQVIVCAEKYLPMRTASR